jgi:hypothetical protein
VCEIGTVFILLFVWISDFRGLNEIYVSYSTISKVLKFDN